MQRKLSEIAEIPKILSSTLATVSQTFDKLMPAELQQPPQQQKHQEQLQQHRLRRLNNRNEWQPRSPAKQSRKHSYDEDALDYELSTAGTARRVKLKAKGKAIETASDKLKVKDVTPESDYASEGNYEPNEADTDNEHEHENENEIDNTNYNKYDVDDDDDDEDVTYDDDDDDDVDDPDAVVDDDDAEKDGDDDALETTTICGQKKTKTRRVDNSIGVFGCNVDHVATRRVASRRRPNPVAAKSAHVNVNINVNDDVSATGADDADESFNEYNDDDDDDIDESNEDEDEDEDDFDYVSTALDNDSDSVDGDDQDNDVEDQNDEDEEDEEDDDDDDDFLNATYTWNLRKIPKLQLNDEESANDNDAHDQLNLMGHNLEGKKQNKQRRRWSRSTSHEHEVDVVGQSEQTARSGEKPEKFTEKLERSWPWADREKIIYKQSTCHLVRRRPLGLVEQRIKLLAKQHLGESLEKQLH